MLHCMSPLLTHNGHRSVNFAVLHNPASFDDVVRWVPRQGRPMRRREFIALLGGGAATWPLAVRAQQSGKLPTIGFLGASTSSAASQWSAAFVQRQRELGWIE